jgi:phage terminase small subunit
MGRPPKPIKATTGANTKREIQTRIVVEDKLAGVGISSVPPVDFSENRAIIYEWLYEALEPSGVLSVLDSATFKQACVIIDRLNELDAMIDELGVANKELRMARSDYFNQYLKVCSELCLSPAARAKMGTYVANKVKDEDPLLSALGGGNE